MDVLVHLFHTVITYPVLNLLIWLYLRVHSFALTIVLLACFRVICLEWPARYLREQRQRLYQFIQPRLYGLQRRYAGDHTAQREATRAIYEELKWSMGYSKRLLVIHLPRLLTFLAAYFTFGMYFALVVLGGSTLKETNDILYPALVHLEALPDYQFSFLGQAVSLVQHGILPTLLVALALLALANAYLAVRRSQGLPEQRNCRLGCTFLLAAFIYPLQAVIACAVAWLFASGTLLDGIASGILEIVRSGIWSRRASQLPGSGEAQQ